MHIFLLLLYLAGLSRDGREVRDDKIRMEAGRRELQQFPGVQRGREDAVSDIEDQRSWDDHRHS